MDYTILLFSGIITGVLASIFGFGGGLTVVPTLLICLPMFHVAPELTMHIAIGTSFGVMLFSNINAAIQHHKSSNLDFNIFKLLVPWIIAGIIISLGLSSILSSHVLQYFFVFFVFYVIIKSIFKYFNYSNSKTHGVAFVMPNKKLIYSTGIITGLISGCVGGGSSLIIVPFLSHRHMEIKKSVAISTACNIILATVGFIGSIITGFNAVNLPHYSFGYIFLPVLIILLAGSYIGVLIGSKIVNKLKESILKLGYLAVLIIIFGIILTKLFVC